MKKFIIIFVIISVINACKKDEKITESEKTQIITPNSDSTEIATENPKIIATPDSAPKLKPLNEIPAPGKAVFSQNDLVMFVFNTQSQTGKITIDGKEYALNQLNFTENNYEITGNGIKIIAEDGQFQDITSDCVYGEFPKIKILVDGHEINLQNVKVQDCPVN